jgi:prepilin-type N-terminal cleavage/methylation domain-containing protein
MLLRARRHRHAFNLMELLVVISIITLLVGLLLPAIQYIREPANRTVCANHLKQIGLAMHYHHNVHGRLPAFSKDGPDATTWCVMLLPFLEQEDLYKLWDLSKSYYEQTDTARLTQVETYFCPSRRSMSSDPTTSLGGDQPFLGDDGNPSLLPNTPGALGDYAACTGSCTFM